MSQDVVDIVKELADNGIKENTYGELEQNYHSLLNEMGTDTATEKFRDEIDKVYRTFQVAMANEKILIRMLKEMKKRAIDDAQTINKIRETQREDHKELETLYKKLGELKREKQIATQEKKELVRNEISLADKIKEDYIIDESKVEELEGEKIKLKLQLENLTFNYEKQSKELNEIQQLKEKMDMRSKESDTNIKELNQKLDNEMQMNKKKIEEKEIEHTSIKNMNLKNQAQIEDLKTLAENLKKQIGDNNIKLNEANKNIEYLKAEKLELEMQLKRQERANDDQKKEKKILHERVKESSENVKRLESEKDRIQHKMIENENSIKERNREIDKLNKELNELRIIIRNQDGEINLKKQEVERYRSLNKEEIKRREKERYIVRQKETEIKKLNENKDNLQTILMTERGDLKGKLETIHKLKEDLSLAEKVNSELEKNRDKITEENTKLKNKIEHLIEENRLADNQKQELLKKVSEGDKKMKLQREVYDAVRRDKNLYFKNLIETQDDLIDKQNLLQFNKKEIENLKSDLKKKDDYIVNLKSKNSTFEDALKNKQNEADHLRTVFDQLKQITATQEKEIEKLKIEGQERAKDYKKVDNEYKKTIIDRDNISSQLIRRNDEVSLLHEKIMILTSDLSRSEKEYQETKELINKYIRENRNLLRELEISKNYKSEAKNFAKEIINLHKELLREKNLVSL